MGENPFGRILEGAAETAAASYAALQRQPVDWEWMPESPPAA